MRMKPIDLLVKTVRSPLPYFNVLCLLFCLSSLAQTSRTNIKGIVRNERGEPLSNVSVAINNTRINFTAGTQTDTAGMFTFLRLPSGSGYSFTFSIIGYETQTMNRYTLKSGADFSLVV